MVEEALRTCPGSVTVCAGAISKGAGVVTQQLHFLIVMGRGNPGVSSG